MKLGLDALPGAAAVVDARGAVRQANGALTRMFELGEAALAGRRADSLVPDLAEVVPGEGAGAARVSGRRQSGVPFTADLEISHLGGGNSLWLVREVRDERLMTEAMRYLDVAFERSPIGMALFDTDGRYVRANAALGRMLGYSPAELVGRRDQDLTHPEDRRSDVDAAWPILNGERDVWQAEKRFVAADGSTVWVIANLSFLRDDAGRPISWLGQFQDITARKETEAAIVRFAAEQSGLRRIATAVASEAPPDTVFAFVAEEAALLVQADMGAVMRFLPDGTTAVLVGGWGQPPAIYRATVAVGDVVPVQPDTATGAVLRTGAPARLERLTPDVVTLVGEQNSSSAAVAAPVRVNGRLWGCITVVAGRESLPPGTESDLAGFAELLSMALASADARAQLSRLASNDPMTGLPNRHVFTERLAHEVQRAHRHGRPLALVILDLDHFKRVNDTHGHQTGDLVLIEAARRLAALPRQGETMARVGGEEFAWILPETGDAGALAAAERARQAMAAAPFDGVGTMTLSAGYCADSSVATPEDLFRRADQALYRAKRQGRNASRSCVPAATPA